MLLLDINVIKNTVVIIKIKCINVKCMVPIFLLVMGIKIE